MVKGLLLLSAVSSQKFQTRMARRLASNKVLEICNLGYLINALATLYESSYWPV
jgi:hypothetical protein